ncbi:flagellar filament capping protein FliD [Pseudomonas sp. NCCP-436]|uniref:flagellar filament capping protein FliD n=1 Tax=Pseudomonas sp. NCCP-436 TaxID=2842481 RepID=UPI001C817A91|nr:flagellar filament capping protein FliD [Pseudomonas sp. NCCP-436]GIZ12188.1 B-type flagellar hook-associated protein 2 [Pseudomonas sp. NCCP-436]
MAGITGIGSGIDIDSIVQATIAAERAPKDSQLNRVEANATAKISALGTLRSALSEFQTALKGLNDISLFNTRTASSSDSARVTATADKNALAGKYSIEVLSLATSSKLTSGVVAGDSSAVFETGGTLRIGLGTEEFNLEIADGATLKDVRDAINERLKDEGISANIISDPVAGSSRLVLSSNKTGDGNDLSISVEANDPDNPSSLDALASGASVVSATNARFKVDGLELESASNQVSKVIEGVTFNLLQANGSDENKVINLTVGDNTAAVKSNLQKFVDAYNKLITTTDSLTRVTQVSGSTPLVGGLVGDTSVRNLLNGLRKELGAPAANTESGDFRVLADLGITTGKDGKLSINSAKLDKALAENYDGVGRFLTGTEGLMGRLNNSVNSYTKTDGVLEQRVKGYEKTREDVKEQRAALDLRVEKMQARLYAQYNAMDTLIGQLTRTSDWMSSALANLPGVVRKDK